MNILMMTNTYAPHVGGVARSVKSFTEEFRRRGHRVVVVAPPYDGPSEPEEKGVVRVPALKHFHGGDFSLPLPPPGFLTAALEGFRPDVVHAHHPFLLGDTAMVAARVHGVPLVFTHHTMYEHYTHNVPGDSPAVRRFAARFAAGFANLADRVFAPSRSVAQVLRSREVRTDIDVVPTGIDLASWRGDGVGWRREKGVPPGAPVAAHLGRLAPEKNLGYLARALAHFLRERPDARFVLAGEGSEAAVFEEALGREGLAERFIRQDGKEPRANAAALSAADVFVFSSLSETQGMVLAEAMACGAPVVALDAPGVRDVVDDGRNGRLLSAGADERAFARALVQLTGVDAARRAALREEAQRTAAEFSLEKSARKALAAYEELAARRKPEPMPWEAATRWAAAEWAMLRNLAESARLALSGEEA